MFAPTSGSPCVPEAEEAGKVKGPGTLHLIFSLDRVRGKVLSHLRACALPFTESGRVIHLHVPEEDLTRLSGSIALPLTVAEQCAVQTIFQPEGLPLQFDDYFNVCSLYSLIARTQIGWLSDIISENRLTSVFQPIINCDAQGRLFGYEALMRAEDQGRTILPAQLLDVARRADMHFQLDRLACQRTILDASQYKLCAKLFINIMPATFYDAEFSLSESVGVLHETGLTPGQIVFEIVESEHITDWARARRVLDRYRAAGFEIAIDDLGSCYSSLRRINELRPNYVKLDMELVRDVHTDGYRATLVSKILETARALDIKSVAEGIESPEEFNWMAAHGADFAQGFYISRPVLPPEIPADLLKTRARCQQDMN